MRGWVAVSVGIVVQSKGAGGFKAAAWRVPAALADVRPRSPSRLLCASYTTGAGEERRAKTTIAEPGKVYFVSTPIGHLEDITLRAMRILATADIIASEDTRSTGKLLKLLNIERSGVMWSHHEHNHRRVVPEIVSAARGGKSVAVVSEAGTPGISDPGAPLAAACAAAGVTVVPVPGACAAVAAVSVAGFLPGEFVFFGFLPSRRGAARRAKLREVAAERRMCVLYEAPHRIANTLRGLIEADDLTATAGREGSDDSDDSGDNGNSGTEFGDLDELDDLNGNEDEGPGRSDNIGGGGARNIDGSALGGDSDAGGATAGAGGVTAGPDVRSMFEVAVDRKRGLEGDSGSSWDGGGSRSDGGAGGDRTANRPVLCARELTKLHEELYRGTVASALRHFVGATTTAAAAAAGKNPGADDEISAAAAAGGPRGEFTVVLGPIAGGAKRGGGPKGKVMAALEAEGRLAELMAAGMSTSAAVKAAASAGLGLPKSRLYQLALGLQKGGGSNSGGDVVSGEDGSGGGSRGGGGVVDAVEAMGLGAGRREERRGGNEGGGRPQLP